MEPASSSEEVVVCQTCGSEGFTNAFVYCVKCLDFAIHRYCLDVMPRTFDEVVIWFCEHCKPTVPNLVTLPKAKSPQSQKEETACSRHVKATCPNKKQKKERYIAMIVAGTEEVNCQEKTTEPASECIPPTYSSKEAFLKSNSRHKWITRVVAGTEEGISPEPEHAHCLPNKERANMGNAACFDSKKKDHRLQNTLKKKRTQRASKKMVDSIKNSWSHSSPTAANIKNRITVDCSLEGQIDDTRPSQPPSEAENMLASTEHEKLISDPSSTRKVSDKPTNDERLAETGNKMQAEEDIITSKLDSKFSQSANSENSIQDGHCRHARPVIDPVWRGSFEIHNTDYNLFEGFVAHLSNRACDKVCEEANMLPSLLSLEMLPKTVLWPKSFQEHEPSDDNIALYFFPGDTINERTFDLLVVEMMDERLAMRATAKNAELLIFTSTVLPRLYWRFQGKYYLWGVFRGKRNGSTSLTSHDLTVSNNSIKCGLSKDSRNELVDGKKILRRLRTLDARSPQSPLSNNGENGVDMDPESGD